MLIPETFTFTVEDDHIPYYTAKQVFDYYLIEWLEDGKQKRMKYSPMNVERFIRDGLWIILPESFPDLHKATKALNALVNEIKDVGCLGAAEIRALETTRGLINRLLADRK